MKTAWEIERQPPWFQLKKKERKRESEGYKVAEERGAMHMEIATLMRQVQLNDFDIYYFYCANNNNNDDDVDDKNM